MELYKVKDKLSKEQYLYFLELQEKIELPLFFIGSITRNDYVPKRSDIDIEIFSDNIKSTKIKIESLFNYYNTRDENKLIVFEINNIPYSGYKYSYSIHGKENHFDLTLYKKVCQTELLYNRNIETNLNFIARTFFYILKFLHYNLNITSDNNYSYLKKYFWSLYNSKKTTSKTITETEYKYYYNQQSEKSHLIKF
jgi:hypothetical protein